ncbi:transcriptional regulator, Fis family [Thermoproteus uzoniensis 768-20]|uniref:Transcriptional regulator, Fis family n=1 Tax=Thermoproteus uzoniensis (strain 768-20) TaxID=999630 RepID=F2L3V4_THEU7|nr:aminopeptidase P family protein [Thermoproteus uzoniensis]AEA13266.1 transcriptional regulator, Fis family [Thermoproteus uzoniensis 768-20]
MRRLLEALKDYDYVVLTKPSNLAYAIGFPDGLALVVDVKTGGTTLYVSRLDYRRALASVAADRVVAFATAEIPPRGPGEELLIAKNLLEKLKETLGGRVASDSREVGEDVSGKILEVRSIKTEEEVGRMRKALEITEEALSSLHRLEGRREREIAAEIYRHMIELGSDGVAFEPIVGSGPHSAWPHYNYGDRRVTYGDVVVIDVGARYRFYCADMTRTYLVGDVPRQLKDAVYAVYEASRAAEKAIRAGVSAREVDLSARKVLEDYGFGQYFIHSTGHGVGVEVHEPPRLSAASDDVLKEGMVVTVEPGVYIPGIGGVRIENMVYVSLSGAVVMNRLPYIV